MFYFDYEELADKALEGSTAFRRNVFVRIMSRCRRFRRGTSNEVVQLAMSMQELRLLRSTDLLPAEGALTYWLELSIRTLGSLPPPSTKSFALDDLLEVRDWFLEHQEQLRRVTDGTQVETRSVLDLLLWIEAELLLGLLDRGGNSWVFSQKESIDSVIDRLESQLVELKSQGLTRENVSDLLDAAPIRLKRELEWRFGDSMEIVENFVTLDQVVEILGGNLSDGTPCSHGRVNLRAAQQLAKKGDFATASRLLSDFASLDAEKESPLRVPWTLVEQDEARERAEFYS